MIDASSIYFSGSTSSYLSIPANSSLNFGTGTFTIEWYQYMESGQSWPRIFDNGSIMVSIEGNSSSRTFYVWINGQNYALGNGITNIENTWVHFAITRNSSNTISVYQDGGLLGTITNNSTNFTSSNPLYIGKKSGGSTGECFKGYLAYFRWIKGECLYTSVFTPHLSLLNKQPFGVYTAENYAANAIPEFSNTSGMGVTCNSVTLTSASGNGATAAISYVYGTTSSTMEWPSGSIPTTFTICSTTRHNGGTRGRVLEGKSPLNFVHGNYLNKRGVAYYDAAGFVTDQPEDSSDTWLVMCGKVGINPGNIYYDGNTYGIASSASFNSTGALTINLGPYSFDYGDFAFSNVMIWDQALTDAEMVSVYDVLNDYLATGGNAGEYFNQIALTTETNVSLLLLANDGTYKGTMSGSVSESNVTKQTSTINYNPTPPCFLEGTQIAVLRDGVETLVKVEDLRQGDLVNTYKHGPKAIKIIGKRSCQNDKDKINAALYKVAKTEEMIDDLYISGGHGLLKDEAPRGLQFKIDDKYIHFAHQCCEHVDDRRMCTYYNFCMEGDKDERYGVWANGLLCETPSERQLESFGLILL
jgi:Concanavalin A-like lectin/glucanases superfamily/Hint domain